MSHESLTSPMPAPDLRQEPAQPAYPTGENTPIFEAKPGDLQKSG